MSTETQQFTIGQVLSITDGKLVCEMGEVYEILDFMTGDSLMTHQLPRAGRECAPELLRQHPQLESVQVPDLGNDADAYKRWLSTQPEQMLEVAPLAPENHTSIDPIAEMRMMRPDAPIVAVHPTQETE